MATVYSYIRFSSKAQAKGDSLRRQTTRAQEWCEKHSHSLADLSLQDLGVSAYRGKNKHTGALKAFRDAVEDGTVPKDSILLVENLDRLSRQGIYDALELFLSLLNAGIKVAVIKPHEQIYDRRKSDDLVGLLLPLIYFYLAHVESKNKSDRVGAHWDNRRANAADRPITRRRPSWLDWDEAKGFVLNREAAKAIRYIFKTTIEGTGQKAMLADLTKRFAPLGRSGKWNGSFIAKVLNDRAVIGEFQPHTFTPEGERVPVGEPIKNYYPAVIDEATYYKAQESKATRARHKSPPTQWINLFLGLVTNTIDGSACHIQTARAYRKNGDTYTQRRLTSYAHLRKEEGACPLSIDYYSFERFMLWLLYELKPEEVLPSKQAPPEQLQEAEDELAVIKGRIAEIEKHLEDPETQLDALVRSLKVLEAKRVSLEKEVDEIRGQTHTNGLAQYSGLSKMLLDAEDEAEQQRLRLKLRAVIPRLIESIEVTPRRLPNRRIEVDARITYKSGLVKHVVFDRYKIMDTVVEEYPERYMGDFEPKEDAGEYPADLDEKR